MEPKEQIRERLDVAEVIGEYLTLKGAGQGSFKAVCPFHAEKTPSFYVSQPKQIWHCFGCDKGGDIFAFVMEMEGMGFGEAIELLAQKAGVELPKYERKEDDDRGRLKHIQQFAEAVYVRYLQAGAGAQARAYLETRGIPDALAQAFGLGYAPQAWTGLVDLAHKKQIKDQELLDAGLALPSKNRAGVIDRFRHRLMIPLRDQHGNTVGFTGRVLDPNDSPKYMNSPQTRIYDKGALLFGLDLAKSAIKQEGEVVIVEGNLDVIASHKAGVAHVVASSGTALTDKQIRLLKRYTQRLVFAFDADAAGFEAARRGMRLAAQMGCDVRVAAIPAEVGKDPDDLVQKDPQLWQQVVRQQVDAMAFYFDRLVAPVALNDVAGKKAAGKAFLPEVSAVLDPLEREHWMQRFADHTGVTLAAVEAAMRSAPKEKAPVARQDAVAAPAKPEERDLQFDLLFSLCLTEPALGKLVLERLPEQVVPEGLYRQLYKDFASLYTAGTLSPEHKSLFEALRSQWSHTQPSHVSWLETLAFARDRYLDQEASPAGDTQSQVAFLIDRVMDQSRKGKRQQLLQALRRAEAEQDQERVAALLQELQSLIS